MAEETKSAEATSTVAQAIPAVVTPPTVEELEARLEQAERDLVSARQEAKAHQKFGQEKQAELRNQSDFRNQLTGIEQRLDEQRQISELQAAAIALGREGSEEEIAKVNTLLRTKITEQDNNRKQAEVRRQQEINALTLRDYNEKAQAVFEQAKTLMEGDDLKDIEDLLLSGNLIVAQREVRLASKGKTPVTKVGTPPETEEVKIARLVKEQLAKDYPDMYASDNGIPGGTPSSLEQVGRDYAEGKISTEEARHRGLTFV